MPAQNEAYIYAIDPSCEYEMVRFFSVIFSYRSGLARDAQGGMKRVVRAGRFRSALPARTNSSCGVSVVSSVVHTFYD